MACSAGGPMEITILDVDEDDTKCNDCGKKFKRPSKKKKARCPECGSENLGAL
jgi:predicted Zn-ribbon and HTH transcriptional regulator